MMAEEVKRFPEEFEPIGRDVINSDKLMAARGDNGEPVYIEAGGFLIKIEEKVVKVLGKELSTNDFTNDAKAEVAKIVDKVNKVAGKALSTNDYSNEAKAEVAKVTDKVDKVAGKGLSDNNFSLEEKQKLASLNLNLNIDLTSVFNFMNQFLTTDDGELILDANNNIIVTL